MNWQHLIYFEMIAKEEHYTRAAEKLHITQSTLSKAMDNLEKEIGVALFEKDGRNIRLNKYGKIFENHVSYGIKEVDKGVEIIQQMAQSGSGKVSFSSIFTMGADFIPDLIRSFSQKYPNISLSYYQKSTKDILNDVLDKTVEFGFCGEFRNEGEYQNIEKELVKVEPILLAVPQGHAFAKRDSISFSELKNEKLIGYTDNTGINYSIKDDLDKAGIQYGEIQPEYFVAEDNTLLGMVRANLGIGLIADCPHLWTKGIVLIPIKDPYLSRKLYMVWNRYELMNQSAKAFKYHVLSTVNELK